jgi:SHS2 domain-containing protein
MTDGKKFEFLEHTADAYIAACGKSLAEAFENAAAAMFEVMTDVGKVRTKFKDTVEVTGADEYALLYNWLEALLVKFDINETLLSQFKILSLHHSGEGFRLKAEIWGEKFDPRRHVQKVGVKAITYHQMEIIKKQDKVTVKFILDI